METRGSIEKTHPSPSPRQPPVTGNKVSFYTPWEFLREARRGSHDFPTIPVTVDHALHDDGWNEFRSRVCIRVRTIEFQINSNGEGRIGGRGPNDEYNLHLRAVPLSR